MNDFCLGLTVLMLGAASATAVSETLVPDTHSGWRYHDKAEPPPAHWHSPDYDDASWPTGRSPLGYGEEGLATELSFGEDASNKHPAAYFRLHFDAGEISSDLFYGLRVRVDDGAIFYLNGVEIDRIRMRIPMNEDTPRKPESAYRGIKSPAPADPVMEPAVFVPIRRKDLKASDNLLAISVHQADASSSDLLLALSVETFDFKTYGKLKRGRLAFDYHEDINRAEQAYSERVDAFYKEYRAAEGAAKEALAKQYPRPDGELAQLERLVELYPQEPPTIDALLWILSHARRLTESQLATLVEHHFDSERLAEFCLYGSPLPKSFLRKLVKKSPHETVKGAAAYAMANRLRHTTSKEVFAEGVALLRQAIPWLGEYTFHGQSVASMAERLLFELTRLGIGQPAPEITGEDIDGVEFKLSDYRGKVVVIDFWGDW